MKRLPGVIVSAILLILISLLQLLIAVGVVIAGVAAPAAQSLQRGQAGGAALPAWMPAVLYGAGAFYAALAVWGILTAVGLLRLRRWARYSVLVIGGGLALIALFSLLSTLVVMVVSLPLPAHESAAQGENAQAIAKIVIGISGLLYTGLLALGVWWLVYFNLKKVRELFAGAAGMMVESRRPFLIAMIAVLSLIGACVCLAMAFLPIPGGFFGMILHGWAKAVFCLAYTLLLAATGVGLWQLKEWGRRLALVAQGLGLLQYIILLARPSLMARYTEEINRTMGLTQPQMPGQFQSAMYTGSLALGFLVLLAVVWVLHHYRGAFVAQSEPPQIEAASL